MPSKLADVLDQHDQEILNDWLAAQISLAGVRRNQSDIDNERVTAKAFLPALREALLRANTADIHSVEWSRVREILSDISQQRALTGSSPTETARFVLSLKGPLFKRLQQIHATDPAALAANLWETTEILDRLGLFTSEVFQKSREAVIQRQQQEMLELSTPVVRLWEGILALPLIGTLDSARTQVVMQNLLEAILATESEIAIIDITGVPTVDTLVAQHLLKTVAAARLMGADCIISGIRPQIAQTIIHLGVELSEVTTKATLADAFRVALTRTGLEIGRSSKKA